MEIRLQLFLSIITTGLLLAISGFLVSEQITKVRESFDEVQNQATPAIIALGNLKADFNHLVATILAFSIHASEEHQHDIELAREQLLLSYEEYAVVENDPAAAQLISDEIDTLLLKGDDMMMAAEAAMHSHEATGGDEHSSHTSASHGHETADAAEQHGSHDSHGQASDHMSSVEGSAPESDLAGTPDTGGFTEEVLMLHEALLEFDLQAAIVNTEIDARIEENFANMQTKQNAVLAEIGTGANLNILLTAAILGVTGGVGGIVAFSISRRVIELKKTAGEIAQGNLDREITTAGADEIAALATSFEQMRKSLVQAQEELKTRNIELNEVNMALENANVELKKLDRLKDEFISVASHELRSPIHPILGYASMAQDGMISDKEALDVIYKQAKRLRQLANDILDVSRIESGTLPYSMKEVNIHEILASCVEAIRPNVSSAVSIVTDFDNQEVEMVGDSERLTQVFTNLLGNALKFTKKGSISVQTRVSGQDSIVVTVSDTGGGIPKEILPRLFSKFATKKVGDDEAHGTGLGLFISRSIVEAHGGRISAYNNDAEGATFKVELSLKAGVKDAEKPMVVRAEKSRDTR
jgi:signal transduction histidine kinase